MARFTTLGLAALAVAMLSLDAMAGRGGAVRGGMRGAVVGDLVGGENGAKAGAVVGATRGAINKETQARTAYQGTAEYQNSVHSNFNESPPDVLGSTAGGTAKKSPEEVVIRKDGKPILGITFPADWNQKAGDNYISAVSADGQAYAMIVALDKVADKEAGIKKVKDGIGFYLKDIKYDDPSETKGGAMVITGTGKGKKAGVDVVFAAGLFESGKGQWVGTAFVVDSKMDDHYKETIRGICQTVRREKDFAK
jgi:hypothetical protein